MYKKGFTLVELVVVIGIMGAIMLLVVFNSRRFDDSIILQTAATEVSLALRQAQSFGISVKESQLGSNVFTAPYGVAFDITNPTYVFIYSDTNGDRKYDGTLACTGSDECREKIMLRSGATISRLCATHTNNTLNCFSGNIRFLILTYVRPNPEPVIKVVGLNGAEIAGPWKSAFIELVSPTGSIFYVTANSASGQIVATSTMP